MRGLAILIIAGFVFPTLATAQIADPRTVNGQVIGPAEDFATAGPATICLQDLTLAVAEGETAHLEYLGIHSGSVRLVLEDGSFLTLSHGDSFADGRTVGQRPDLVVGDAAYFRVPERNVVQVFRAEGSEAPASSPVLILSGPALEVAAGEHRASEHIAFGGEGERDCTRRYGYGWDGIFWSHPDRRSEQAE